MTTLYNDSRHDYVIIHSTVDEPTIQRWKQIIDDWIEKYEKREQGYWTQFQRYLERYFESPFAELCVVYETMSLLPAEIVDLFPPDRKPVGKAMVSYRWHRLTEDKPSTAKEQPFSLSQTISDDDLHPYETYRINHVYEQNYKRRYLEYSALFCIHRDEGVEGGSIVFYPQYEEENTISSTFSQLITQCALPRKELDIPFTPGSMILLSGNTFYSMEPLRGKGMFLYMIIDFFCERGTQANTKYPLPPVSLGT